MNKKANSDFLQYVVYSIIGAIIFMLVFTLWNKPEAFSSLYGQAKQKISAMSYDVKKDSNIVFIDENPLKIANPPFPYDRFYNISRGGIAYEEDVNNDFLVINFTDNSGYLNDKCFKLRLINLQRSRTICEICSNQTKVKLYCDMKDLFQNPEKGILMGIFYAVGGGLTKELDSVEITEILQKMIRENAQKRCSEGILEYCTLAK